MAGEGCHDLQCPDSIVDALTAVLEDGKEGPGLDGSLG